MDHPQDPKPPEEQKEGGEVHATAAPEDTRVNFTTRIRSSTRRQARIYAAEHDLDIQELVDRALTEYLHRHES